MTNWFLAFVQGWIKLRPPGRFYLVFLVLYCISCYIEDQRWSEVAGITTTEKLVCKCSHLNNTAVFNRQPVAIDQSRLG